MAEAQLPRVTFRFSDELRMKLEDAARQSGWSVNAEVVARLEKSFESDEDARKLAEIVDHHEENINDLWQRIDKLESLVHDINRYGPGER